MITRIVKMTFKENRLDDFKEIFQQSKDTIQSYAGCLHVELCNDINNRNVFFTYSQWTSEETLNEYRKSVFFRSTWSKTKVLFAKKPEAYSLSTIYSSNQITIK